MQVIKTFQMGPKNLKEYQKVVGKDIIKKIFQKIKPISKKHLLCISSTYRGGGVAEILNAIVPLFNEFGLMLGWRILHGSADFFTITKMLHNGLQGEKINLTNKKKKIYLETNKRFSTFTHIDHDLVIIHDPQPLPLIEFYNKKQPWIFRCHVDLSNPTPTVWDYLKKFIKKYDGMIVSKAEYIKKDLKIEQNIIYPAIDPFSLKNKKLPKSLIKKILKKYNIKLEKPIISQISRFDKWKDPQGVIKVFEHVREKIDCQLILLGSLAPDDPEGPEIFEKVKKMREKSKYKEDIKLLLIKSDKLVNCLQTVSEVIIQKSKREGFGLVIAEALYKGTPVVASNVGGIPLQVINGINGFLHQPDDNTGFAESIIKLLKDKKLRNELGKNGKNYIKNNFLITRLMLDWLEKFNTYLK